MSVVERALNKLAQRRAAEAPRRPSQPLARVSVGDSSGIDLGHPPGAKQGSGGRIEFDFAALDNAGLIAAGNDRLAEQYRHVKQPLLKKAAGKDAVPAEARSNLIMVSSALEGEGKTFTSVNLSMSLAAEKDWTVLLVDADCKSPKVSQLLGVADQPGLLDLLREPSLSIESVVFGTNIGGLSVLPVGQPDEHPAELLGSSKMSALCGRLAAGTAGRLLVVFDSSPLLLTTEAAILAGQMGQIVMVVHANKTPRSAVEQAVEMLDPTKSIGLVLNRADAREEALAYGVYGTYSSHRTA